MNVLSNMSETKSDLANPQFYIDQAAGWLESGDESRARDIVVRRRNTPSDDPSVHVKWAKLCEELGMARQARESYERALKISPDDSKILYYLACLLNETGYYEDSIHYLKKVVKHNPDHIEAKKLLSADFLALGLIGQAEVLRPQLKKRADPIRYFPPSISEENTKTFLNLFAGREVGHALQMINQETGDVSFRFMEAPLDHDLVLKHINSDLTLAAYPLRTDNTVKYATVEIRLRKRVLEANIKNQGYLTYLNEKSFYHAISLKQIASQYGIPAYIDSYGEHRYRVWVFFREFIHFLKVKDFLTRFLAQVPAPDSNLLVEPLMATRPIGIGWMEQAILLPLGINRASRTRCLFLDDDGQPYGEQLEFLARIREISSRDIVKAFRKSGQPAPGAQENSLSESVKLLVRSCPVLKELVRRSERGRTLSYEEKVILFYTIGLVGEDGDDLHRLLETCPDYNYRKVNRQIARLKKNPMSCLKIRELVPEITASVTCNCSFDLRGGKYPSPLLHHKPHLVPSSREMDVKAKMPIKEAAQRYINLKRQAAELERAMERLSVILNAHCDKNGINRIRAGKSTLIRKKDNAHTCWEIG
ncbi:MAG: tetratricopeptide repeat protein [Deltaproteobacteria bacterium]|nr:tetratricopeptide repeat protein [Deltaproteobacteria bacterium]